MNGAYDWVKERSSLLIDFIVVGLVVGFLLRGRLANLAEVEVRGLLLAVLAVVVQYGGQYVTNAGWLDVRPYAPYIYLATLLFLFVVIWLNRKNPAIVLMGAGILLNFLVIAVNGGKMPVSAEGLVRSGMEEYIEVLQGDDILTHQLLGEATRLAFLADVFVLPEPYPLPKLFSIGDVVLGVGACWFLIGGMTAHPSVTGKRRAVEVRRLSSWG